jgi:cytoskeletal protein CcmA (bactofilin family)
MKRRDPIDGVLGEGTEFRGKLDFEGTVHIEGHFTGEIRSEGSLVIGPNAVVKGTVLVERLVLQGVLRGNVRARGLITVHDKAVLEGNVLAYAMEMHQGAMLEGNIRITAGHEEGSDFDFLKGVPWRES